MSETVGPKGQNVMQRKHCAFGVCDAIDQCEQKVMLTCIGTDSIGDERYRYGLEREAREVRNKTWASKAPMYGYKAFNVSRPRHSYISKGPL